MWLGMVTDKAKVIEYYIPESFRKKKREMDSDGSARENHSVSCDGETVGVRCSTARELGSSVESVNSSVRKQSVSRGKVRETYEMLRTSQSRHTTSKQQRKRAGRNHRASGSPMKNAAKPVALGDANYSP